MNSVIICDKINLFFWGLFPDISKERTDIMKQLKIGIIGAGRIGSLHAKSITYNVPTATVVGITDVFKANAEKVASELNLSLIHI